MASEQPHPDEGPPLLPPPLAGEGRGGGSHPVERRGKTGKPFANPGRRDHRPRLIAFAKKMRKEPTDAERKLWSLLRREKIAGFRFRRQYPAQGFILDFVCLELGVAIEADGGQHREPAAIRYDADRAARLAGVGIEILRFSDRDILKEPIAVASTIYRELTERAMRTTRSRRTPVGESSGPLPGPPPQAGEGEGASDGPC